jgi:hypothetical protein
MCESRFPRCRGLESMEALLSLLAGMAALLSCSSSPSPSPSPSVIHIPLRFPLLARRLGTLSLSSAILSFRLARYLLSTTLCARFFDGNFRISRGGSSRGVPGEVPSSLFDFLPTTLTDDGESDGVLDSFSLCSMDRSGISREVEVVGDLVASFSWSDWGLAVSYLIHSSSHGVPSGIFEPNSPGLRVGCQPISMECGAKIVWSG